MNFIKAIFLPKVFTGWHMAGVMGLFFGTIISVNMFLAYSAGQTWTGLVVKNTYVESQKFNDRADILKKQASMGWSVLAKQEGDQFSVQLKDWSGQYIKDAKIDAYLGRPVQEGEDRIVKLTPSKLGYSAKQKLEQGLWRVRLDIIGPDGKTWQRSKRFTVSRSGSSEEMRIE